MKLDLSPAELRRLRLIVETETGRSVEPTRLAFFQVCYPAFQGGLGSLAAASAEGEARQRPDRQVQRYREALAIAAGTATPHLLG